MSEPVVPSRPLLPMEEALGRLLAQVLPLGQCEFLATELCGGRILAESLYSPLDVPPHDNSAMDGYAVRAVDVPQPGVVLPVVQRLPAGSVPLPLQPGTAARIFTGAVLPEGADAVVMQEQCEALDGAVRVQVQVHSGQAIRRRGEDLRRGSEVLSAGSRLTAAALGLAATAGAAQLSVARRPRVALFSTGDELALPGQPLRPGQIYNSNRTTLSGLLRALGCEVRDLGIVPDTLAATRAALRQAADGTDEQGYGADLILSSGGVSVGEEDHLKPALQAEGRLDLWQLAIKPGKPLAFGEVRRAAGQTWFVGLPGNPVASFVTFLLLVRPLLLQMQGASQLSPRGLRLPAAFHWRTPDQRREFLRARLSDEGTLTLYGNQSSGVLSSAAWADGLIDLPPGTAVEPGQLLRFLPFNELF